MSEQLLAMLVDHLAVANWQRGNGKKKDYPKQIPRPGVEQDKTYGKDAVDIDALDEFLGISMRD